MPIRLLRPFLVMMPRLKAEESLLEVKRTALGSTTKIEPLDRRRIIGDWQRAAEGPRSKPNFIQQLQAFGVPVVKVPPKAATP